ncbi:MAG: SDR family oxidoreductase [Spirochaetales bacterium]|nr:MAG: SDR family oxidoreductase [Spirochaetales bacterium]
MSGKRVAVVTGGTRGMGADISLAFAGSNTSVVAVYRSNKKCAEDFRATIRELSPESIVLQADVSTREGVNKTVEAAISSFGRIDILVNNAGIFDFVFIEEMDEKFLDNILNVNFKSMVFMIQACTKHMKKNSFGRIINASSISSDLADVGLLGYGASKAAVNMLTKIAAAELAPYSITVNAYAPGIIKTDLTAPMIKERGHLQVKQIPLNRFGSGGEVAALVKFLASDEAGYITGEIIGIDGGMLKVQNPYRAHEYVQQKP